MRASAKFMLTAVAVCLTIGVLMVGVFAATSGNMQLTSLVKWQSIGVEMDIHGKVTGNHSGDAIASTYEDSLTLANDSKSSAWSIGAMNFVMAEDSTNQVRYSRPIVMRFGFTNNSTHKVNIYYYFAEAPTVISNVNYEYQLAHGTLGSGETWESDFFNANYSGNMSVSGVSDKYYSVHKDTEQNFVAPGETVVFEIRFTVAVFTQSISTAALTTSLVFQNSPRQGMKPTIYIDGVQQTNVAIAGPTVGDYLDALDGSEYPGYFYDADLTIYADEDDIVTNDTKLYTKSATLDELTFTSNGDGTCRVGTNAPRVEVIIPLVSPAGDSVTSIGSNAFRNDAGLTSVTIPNSVTSIGSYAFYYCTRLTSITIPDSVTSIGSNAFAYCKSLSSITIPDSVTSIGNSAFDGCSGLTSITIPDSVTTIGDYAFSCRSLTSIIVSGDNPVYDSRNNCNAIIETPSNTLIAGCKNTVIPNNVTSIGSRAFYGCTGLTSITIPDSVTSIGSNAFYYCEGLRSITIPDSVTSIGSQAFSGCGRLTSIVVSSGNEVYDSRNNCNAIIETSSNTLIAGCKNTVIPNNVTSIGDYAFGDCTSLTSIEIPNSVTSIGSYAFNGCNCLTSIEIPNSVTSIGSYAFYYCTSLTSITIPNSVTSIGSYAFYYCTGLTSITIGDSVTSIGSKAFAYCTSLTSIYIPSSVTTISASNYYNSPFYNCSSSLKIYCGASSKPSGWGTCWNYYNSSTALSTTWGVTREQYYSQSGIKPTIYIDGVEQTNVAVAGPTVGDYLDALDGSQYPGYFYDADLTIYAGEDDIVTNDTKLYTKSATLDKLTFTSNGDGTCGVVAKCDDYSGDPIADGEVVVPMLSPIGDKVINISDYGFFEAWNMEKMVISNNVTSIGSRAFKDCTSLMSITIPDSVTSIGDSAFYDCDSLTSITIPDSVTSIGDSAFRDCASLTSITIGDSVTSIGNSAFEHCSGLTSITIPDSVTSIGNSAFYDCTSLTSITIGDGVTTIGDYAFISCTSLTSIVVSGDNPVYDSRNNCNALIETPSNILIRGCKNTVIPNNVTSIRKYAFNGCSGLTSIEIPDSVTTIGDYAFKDCTGLTNITIPDSVTSIGSYAFEGCTSLTNITIGDSVTSIGSQAFSDCTSLTTIYIPSSVTTISGANSSSSPFCNCSSSLKIYCGASSKPSGWGTYWNYYNSSTALSTTWGVTREQYNSQNGVKPTIYIDGVEQTNVAVAGTTVGDYLDALDGSQYPGYFYDEDLTIYADEDDIVTNDTKLYTKSATLDKLKFTSNGDGTYSVAYSNIPVAPPKAAKEKMQFSTIISTSNCVKSAESLSIIIPMKYSDGGRVNKLSAEAFYDCGGLTSITIPYSVTSIGSSAFYGCSGLTSITIPDSVTSIGDCVFYACTSLTSITIPDSVTSIGSSAFKGCSGLTSITIPDSVTSIDSDAFFGCTGLTNIYIPSGVTTIPTSNPPDSPFGGCSSSLKIYCGASSKPSGWGDYWNYYNSSTALSTTWGVTREQYNSQNGVKPTIYIDGVEQTNVAVAGTTVGDYLDALDGSQYPGYFYDADLTIYAGEDDIVTNDTKLYTKSATLDKLTFTSNGDGTCSVTAKSASTLNSKVYKDYGKTSIKIVAPGAIELNGEIVIPRFSSSGEMVTRIDDGAFYLNGEVITTGLVSIILPDTIKNIREMAFYNCSSLTRITIPDSVTSIEMWAFKGCTSLTSIYIPSSVTTIAGESSSNSPFYNCSSSLKIYCGASTKPSGWGTCWNYYNSSTALSTTWGVTREQYNSQYA